MDWTDDPRSRVTLGGVTVTRMVHPSEAHGAHRVDYPTLTVYVWPDHHSALFHARLIRKVIADCGGPEHLIGRLVIEGCETTRDDSADHAGSAGG